MTERHLTKEDLWMERNEAYREVAKLRAEIERLRAEVRFAKGEFQCLRNWLDRAVASEWRYRDDPALPGHRKAADGAAIRMNAALLLKPLAALEQKVGDDGWDQVGRATPPPRS